MQNQQYQQSQSPNNYHQFDQENQRNSYNPSPQPQQTYQNFSPQQNIDYNPNYQNNSYIQNNQYPGVDQPQNIYMQNYQQFGGVQDEDIIQRSDSQDLDNYEPGTKLSDLSHQARLGITTLMCYYAVMNESFKNWMFSHFPLSYISMIVGLVVLVILVCSRDCARKVPNNYILLLLFTLAQSYMVALVCATIDQPMIVFEAFFITSGIFLVLTIYAMTTKSDFTDCSGVVLMMLTALMLSGFILMFTKSNKIQVFYAFLSALVFCFIIVYDTQLIIGTKSHKYNIDDYIIASIELYLDFLNLLIDILRILSRK